MIGEAMNIAYSIIAKDQSGPALASAQKALKGVKGAAGEAADATESFASRSRAAATVVGGAMAATGGAILAMIEASKTGAAANAQMALSVDAPVSSV